MRKLFCRWLAVMLALPVFLLVMAVPEMWPVWVFGWLALVATGFG